MFGPFRVFRVCADRANALVTNSAAAKKRIANMPPCKLELCIAGGTARGFTNDQLRRDDDLLFGFRGLFGGETCENPTADLVSRDMQSRKRRVNHLGKRNIVEPRYR